MKLLSLNLRGAVGIERGLGVDEINIDFTAFEPGLVAFVAENGRGKSTLLENLQPYRRLITRDGALARHFGLKDSRRDLRFEMAGDEYRSLILIDGVRGGQEAYLYRDGEPMTDGKTATYDAAVRELFGSEDLFFRSLFQAQSRESITALTAGRRKELFVELLGLRHLAEYHERAKARASELEAEIQRARAAVEVYREQAAEIGAIETRIINEAARMADLQQAQMILAADIKQAREAVLVAEQRLAAFDAMKRDFEAAQTEYADRERAWHEAQQAESRARVKAEDEIIRAEQNQGKAEYDMNIVRGEAEAKIARAEKLVANRGTIAEKLTEIARLQDALDAHEQECLNLMMLRVQLKDAESAYNEAHANRREHMQEIERHEAELGKLNEAAKLAQEVPCRGSELQPACKLLKSAVEAEARIDVVGSRISELYATRPPEPDRSKIADITHRISAYKYDSALHQQDKAALAELETTNWQRLEAEAQTAEAIIAEVRVNLADAEKRSRVEMEAIAARLTQVHADWTEEKKHHSAAVHAAWTRMDQAGDRMRKLEAELFERAAAAAARDTGLRRLADLEAAHAERESMIAASRDILTRAEAQIETARAAAAKLAEAEASIVPTISEHQEWALLTRACGANGIQALELDAAGPGVSQIANQLLADTFGSEFQIAFETTRQSSDGKRQIETFDIRVYSGGAEQTIENLSGGQRVWIEAAISQAIAIYLRRKSGLDLRTSFLDEADGALDSENAFKYLSMLRASHALAGTYHTLLITHRQELLTLIPQQIRLVPGEGVRIES